MTSKLIERLINKDYLTERERKEWLGIIKERLEALENENQILNQSVKDTYDTSQEIIYELKQENEKLKMAIELFKERIHIQLSFESMFDYTNSGNKYYIMTDIMQKYLTQQEYELIKEVLGSEL